MKLIDGDALRGVMYHEAFETDSDMQRWDSGCWIRYKMFENAIDNAPTIDAVPVEHAKWINPTRVPDSMLSECSACGFDTGSCTFNYCPNCGAKMTIGGGEQDV